MVKYRIRKKVTGLTDLDYYFIIEFKNWLFGKWYTLTTAQSKDAAKEFIDEYHYCGDDKHLIEYYKPDIRAFNLRVNHK